MAEDKLPTLDELNSNLPTLDDLNQGLKKKEETEEPQPVESTSEVSDDSFKNVDTPFGQLLKDLEDPLSVSGQNIDVSKPDTVEPPSDRPPIFQEISKPVSDTVKELNKKNEAQLSLSKKRIQENIDSLMAKEQEIAQTEGMENVMEEQIKQGVIDEGGTEWVANRTVDHYRKLKEDKLILETEAERRELTPEQEDVFGRIADMQNKELLGEDYEEKLPKTGELQQEMESRLKEAEIPQDKVYDDYTNYLKVRNPDEYANYAEGRYSKGDEEGYDFYLDALAHQERLMSAKKDRGLMTDAQFEVADNQLKKRYTEVVIEDPKFESWANSRGILGFQEYSQDLAERERAQARIDAEYKQALIDIKDPFKAKDAAEKILYYNVVAPALTGTMKFGVGVIGSAGRLSTVGKSDIESRTVNNFIDDFSDYFDVEKATSPYKLPTELKGEGVTATNVVPKSAEMIAHLGVLLTGGGVVGEALEATALTQAATSKIGLFTSTFLSAQNDYYKSAREMTKEDGSKMTNDEAMAYANTAASVTSALMLTNPRAYVYRRQIGNSVISKTNEQIIKGADWKTALKNNWQFAIEEQKKGALLVASTTVGDNIVNATFNNVTGSQFETVTTGEQWEEALIMGSIISGAVGTKGFKSGNTMRNEALYRAMKDSERFNKTLNTETAKRQYTSEEITKAKQDVKDFTEIYESIDPKYLDVYRMDLAADMLNKRRLEEKKVQAEKIDPIVGEETVKKIDAEIQEIDANVKETVKKSKEKPVEEVVEDVEAKELAEFEEAQAKEEAPKETLAEKRARLEAKREPTTTETPSSKDFNKYQKEYADEITFENKDDMKLIRDRKSGEIVGIQNRKGDKVIFEEVAKPKEPTKKELKVEEVEEAPKEKRKPIKEPIPFTAKEPVKEAPKKNKFTKEPTKVKGKSYFEFEDAQGEGFIVKRKLPGYKQDRWVISSDKAGKLRGDESFRSAKEAERWLLEQEVPTRKTKEDAVSKRKTEEVPVQPEARVGEEVVKEVPQKEKKVEPKKPEAERVVEPSKEVRTPKVKKYPKEAKQRVDELAQIDRDIEKARRQGAEGKSSPKVVSDRLQKLETERANKAKEVELIEELVGLPKSESTRKVYAKIRRLYKAQEMEIPKDVAEIVSKKAKEYREAQAKLEKELKKGIDEGEVFQRETTQERATKSYTEALETKLRKVFPKIETIVDKTIKVAGTIKDGKIVVNPKKMGVDTKLHEVSEIWTALLRENNAPLYNTVIETIRKNKHLMEEMSSRRKDLTNDKDVAHEILNEVVGIKTAKDFQAMLAKGRPMKSIYRKVWDAIRKFFGMDKVNYRDLPNMTLERFTEIASKEILSEKPLSHVTPEQLNKLLKGEVDFGAEITIESDILNNMPDGRIKNFLKEWNLSSGKLPKKIANTIFQSKSQGDAMADVWAKNQIAFDKALRKEISKHNLTKEQIGDVLVEAREYLMSPSERTVGTIKMKGNDASLNFYEALSAMKKSRDDMSKALVDSGLLPKGTVATINETMGTYLHRSYEIHKVNPKGARQWMDKMRELDAKNKTNVVETALNEMAKSIEEVINNVEAIVVKKVGDRYYIRGKNTEVLSEQETDPETGEVTKEGETKDRFTNDVEIDQETLRTLLGEVKNKYNENVDIDKVMKSGQEISFNGASDTFKDLGVKFDLKDQTIRTLEGLIGKNINESDFIAFSTTNKKDVSILKNRKDLPEWYRNVLGEIKDPSLNYLETMNKMTDLLTYSKMLNDVKLQAEGSLLFRNEADAPGEYKRISAEGNVKWKPIDGYYAHPEFEKALKDFDKSHLYADPLRYVPYSIWQAGNSWAKQALTKYSILTNARNHVSSVMMVGRLGIDPLTWGKAYKDYWKAQRGKGTEAFKQEVKELKELGLLGDEVSYNTWRQSSKAAMKNARAIEKYLAEIETGRRDYDVTGKVLGVTKRTVKKASQVADKFYVAPDAASKIAAYRMKLKDFKKMYPELTKDNPMEVKKMAANSTLDQLPSYARMSRAARMLSKNQIFGAFSSFSTEQWRNNANQLREAYQMRKEGKKTGNKEMIKYSNKLYRNLFSVSAIIPTASLASIFSQGMTKEDLDAIKSLYPDWNENSWMIYWKMGDGKFVPIDLSFSDPQAVITNSITPFFNNNDSAINKIIESMEQMAKPLIGYEALFKKTVEAYNNENSFGSPIVKPAESSFNHWTGRIGHVAEINTPRAVQQTKELWDIYFEKNEDKRYGDEKDFAEAFGSLMTGVKYKELDVAKLMSYKMYDYAEGYYATQDLEENPEQANIARAELFHEIQRNVTAMRLVGMTEDEIEAVFKPEKGRKMPASFVHQIMTGTLLPVQFEKPAKIKKPGDKGAFGGEAGLEGGGLE